LFQLIERSKFEYPFKLNDSARDLLEQLIQHDPNKRLTSKQILQHPWMFRFKFHKLKDPDINSKLDDVAIEELKKIKILVQESNLNDDQMVSFRLIRRKYQLHFSNLPASHVPIRQNNFKRKTQNNLQKIRLFPTGPPSNAVPLLLPDTSAFISVRSLKKRGVSVPSRFHVTSSHLKTSKGIRSRQTIRKVTTKKILPVISQCKYPTLDDPKVVWNKILKFFDEYEKISIISENNYELYCKFQDSPELDFILTLGSVHPLIGIVGFVVQKVKGKFSTMMQIEKELTEYLRTC
jgi:serine/threonine protein kinase